MEESIKSSALGQEALVCARRRTSFYKGGGLESLIEVQGLRRRTPFAFLPSSVAMDMTYHLR